MITLFRSSEWRDEVGGKIASMILMSIAEIQKRNLASRSIAEMSAEECELLARLNIEDNDVSSFFEVLRYASAAIEKDPSGLSLTLGTRV